MKLLLWLFPKNVSIFWPPKYRHVYITTFLNQTLTFSLVAISNIRLSSTVEKVFPYYRLSFSSIHRYFWDYFRWLWSLWDFFQWIFQFSTIFALFLKSFWFDWTFMCLIQPLLCSLNLDWSEEDCSFRAPVRANTPVSSLIFPFIIV